METASAPGVGVPSITALNASAILPWPMLFACTSLVEHWFVQLQRFATFCGTVWPR